jgi:hypothetical protein
MFKARITKNQVQSVITEMSELDFARFLYCQEIAGAFLAVSQFESALISAMLICDQVKLQKKLGTDETAWAQIIAKKKELEGSTLGSLIKILERHDIVSTDLNYLRWIKDKRDYFIHRHTHEVGLAGDLGLEDCHHMRRRLLAIQLWLERGEHNIWLIFERAGFLELTQCNDGGFLAMNGDLHDLI